MTGKLPARMIHKGLSLIQTMLIIAVLGVLATFALRSWQADQEVVEPAAETESAEG